MVKILSLAMGGACGTLARYFFSSVATKSFGNHFPFGTATVNICGCLMIGFLAALFEHHGIKDHIVVFLLIAGVCGAFTTFSTFIFEIYHMIRSEESLKAFIYILVSISIGFLFFRLGVGIADLVTKH